MTKTRDLADLGGGFIQTGTGAVQRSVESKLGDVVSVKDFGAVGDGVTDDTVAIQTAVNSGATSITFPQGTYIVSSGIAVNSNQSFYGPGTLKTASVINPPPTYGVGNSHWGIFHNYQKTNLKFQGISFDTSGTSALPPGASSLRAIYLVDCSDIHINGCRSIGKGGFTGLISCDRYVISDNFATQTANWADGVIDNWGGWTADGQHFQIVNNNVNGSGVAAWGVLVTGVNPGQAMSKFAVVNNTVQGIFYTGIWINGRAGVNQNFSVTGNIVHSSGEGIRLSDCKDAVISNNVCKSNSYGGISLDAEPGWGSASCENIKVSENLLVDNAVAGGVASLLVANNTRRCAITGNSIYSATHTAPIRIQGSAFNNSVRNNYYDFAQGEIANVGGFNLISGKLGAYSPTITGLTNYAAGGVGSARFRVEQGRVYVDIAIAMQPTSGSSVYTSFGISLPIASNFTAVQDCVGLINGGESAAGIIQADTTNDRAIAAFRSTDTGYNWYNVSFSYDIK